MNNEQVAQRLITIAGLLADGNSEHPKKRRAVFGELQSDFGRAAVGVSDLDTAIRKSRLIDSDTKKKVLKLMGDAADALDEVSELLDI